MPMPATKSSKAPGRASQVPSRFWMKALDGEAIEDDLAVGGVDDVVGVVIDEVEGLFDQNLGLGFLGDGIHFPELWMFAQPADDGSDAGHVRGFADFDERFRGGGDPLTDE